MATKVGNFLRKVKSTFSSISAKSQGASALKATAIPGAVTKALSTGTAKAQKDVNTYNTQTAAQKPKSTGLVGLNGQPVAVPNFSPNSVNINQAIKSGGLTINKKGSGGSSLNKASAPTDVSKINNSIGTFNLDGGSSFSSQSLGVGSSSGTSPMGAGSAGVASSTGALKGLETSIDQKIADAKEAEIQRLTDSANEKKTLFDKLLGNERTPSEVGAETKTNLENEYGIKSQIAEINSLTDSLNKVEVEKQAQVTQAQDKLGTNNFINNQVQQIDRNSRPIIDRLKADINFKTGILTQNRELIAEAVTQATAQSRDKWERLKYTYEENKDLLDSIDKVYADSYKRTIDMAEEEYQRDLELHDWKVEMRLKYGANININDSEQTILDKISRVGGRTISDRSSGGSNTGSVGFKDSKIEAEIRGDAVSLLDEVDLGNTTLDKVYTKLRRLYSPSEVTDDAIKNLIGLNVPQQISQEVVEPSKMTANSILPGGKDSITNPFFGINDWGTTSLVNKISNFLFK